MTNRKIKYIVVFALLAALSGIIYSQTQKIRLAVSPFDSLTVGAEKETAGVNAARIVEEGYNKLQGFEVRKSGAVNDYVNKLTMAQAGIGDLDSLKGADKDLNIDYLTVGSVSVYGNQYDVDARTVNLNNWLIVHSTGISSFDLDSASQAVCRDAKITLTAQDIKDKESLERTCISVYKFIGCNTAAEEAGLGGVFAELLNSELSTMRGISVIERTYSRKLINEKILVMAGVIENDTTDEGFRIRGIDYKVTGRLTMYEGLIGISYSLASTMDNKSVFAGYTEIASLKDMRQAARYIAKLIEASVNDRIGSIEIASDPNGADVEIDGKPFGKKTPFVTSLGKGPHAIRIMLGEYEGEYQADVKSKEINKIRIKLKSSKGSLKVTTKPDKADVEVDGIRIGKTPILNAAITKGKHKVNIYLEGYKSEVRDIEVKTAEKIVIDSALMKDDRTAITIIGGIAFVYVKGGEFAMGSPAGQGENDEHPQHRVALDPFYIGKYEITQKQYRAITEAVPSQFSGEDMPVDSVSWNDAMEFCRRFSEKYKVAVRLPYEAEWEYACKAGSVTKYYWGENVNPECCWYYENSNQQTRFAGSRKCNAWGIHDMSGNVSEWCMDWYSDKYYQVSSARNPKGPDTGRYRVLRGGSWYDDEYTVRSTQRIYVKPKSYNSLYGFRVAYSVQ
ncbi:MAG: SUMF1/EgtB/PvdO family nonheme iron enzyme [Spirochaetota bacterium]